MVEGFTNRINIRVTPAEYKQMQSRARQAGLSMSEYLRRRALRDRDGPTIVVADDVLKNMLRNLKGAATNINQIAYIINARHKPEEVLPELHAALARVEASADSITEFIIEARESI